MKKACLAVCVLVVGAFMVGCGQGSGGGEEYAEKPVMEMHPNKEKYDFMQYKCPVDGKTALKEEFFAEVDDQGRIYFDSKDCMQKFKENPQQYLQDYTRVQEQMGKGGAPKGN